MKKDISVLQKLILIIRFVLVCFAFLVINVNVIYSQTNLALTATSTHSSGGSGAYAPVCYNDNRIDVCSGSTWGWVNSGAYIEYTWATNQTFGNIKFYKGTRPFTSLDIQYWNVSAYVSITTYSVSTACTAVSGGYHEVNFIT